MPWILLVNIAGLIILFILLAGKLTRLVQDYRRHVPGSRLKGRTVAIFSALAVAPILVVYYFSLQFINRGIDSWFELEVSEGLKDTRALSHAALEVRVREFLQHTQTVAHTLSHSSDFDLIATLDRERRESAGTRIHHRGYASADSRHQLRSTDGHAAGARHRRYDAAAKTRRALCESGHRLGGRLRDSRGGAARCQPQRQCAGADRLVSRAAAVESTGRYGAAVLHAVCESRAIAQTAQDNLRPDPDLRGADVADCRSVRRLFRRPAPGPARAGLDRGNPRRGEGQLRHQAAAAVARRARFSGHLVQRHDQAVGACPRGNAAQPAGR